ncbi:hypothetical protein OpiT1DRAFT_04756 [Opitutaceae bacterium TAV1]|nr:hypothetical protein OpiT1DRAFT_04756 [Opitutaceae bacterium TAV1]
MPTHLFEWNLLKSLNNWVKHGATLGDALKLWEKGANRKLTRAGNKNGETRFHAFGHYKNSLWTAVFTLREGRVRVISFRKASRKERAAYFGG